MQERDGPDDDDRSTTSSRTASGQLDRAGRWIRWPTATHGSAHVLLPIACQTPLRVHAVSIRIHPGAHGHAVLHRSPFALSSLPPPLPIFL